jgi:hypothetical protein
VNYSKSQQSSKKVTVVGLDSAGAIVAAARAQSTAIDQAVIDTAGFRFGKVLDLWDPTFLPGGAKYGDVPALLALNTSARTWVAGETAETLAQTQAQFKAANAGEKLTLYSGDAEKIRSAAVEWLLGASAK